MSNVLEMRPHVLLTTGDGQLSLVRSTEQNVREFCDEMRGDRLTICLKGKDGSPTFYLRSFIITAQILTQSQYDNIKASMEQANTSKQFNRSNQLLVPSATA